MLTLSLQNASTGAYYCQVHVPDETSLVLQASNRLHFRDEMFYEQSPPCDKQISFYSFSRTCALLRTVNDSVIMTKSFPTWAVATLTTVTVVILILLTVIVNIIAVFIIKYRKGKSQAAISRPTYNYLGTGSISLEIQRGDNYISMEHIYEDLDNWNNVHDPEMAQNDEEHTYGHAEDSNTNPTWTSET